MARLIAFKGTNSETIYDLGDEPVTVGRHPDNTIHVLDAKASREHCRIVKAEEGYEVRDNGSRNGTVVNGVAVMEAPLSDGDRIQVGNTVLYFEEESGTEPSTVVITEEAEDFDGTVVEAALNVREATLLDPETPHPDLAHLRRAEQALSVLYEGAQLLSSGKEMDDLLDAVTGLALDLTSGDRAFIAMCRDDGVLEIRAARPSLEGMPQSQIAISKTIANVALGEKTAVLCSDAQMDARFRNQQSIYMHRIRSVLYVPLTSHDKVLGILGVDATDPLKKFTKEHLRHLSILANHSAAALDNLRLQEEAVRQKVVDQQLEIAREIQQNFLPSDLSIVPNVEMAASSLPAMLVGGDFYDCIPLDKNRTALVIGDVAGKGFPAALCMGRVMGDIRGLVAQHEAPEEILTVLNKTFLKRSTRGMFISLILMLLDASAMSCTICNAGHPMPILLRHGSPSPQFIEERGGPTLGIADEAEYVDHVFLLGAGDLLFLYTDGLIEAQSVSEEFFGIERLAENVCACRDMRCTEIIETVFDRVTAFAGTEAIPDDLTTMVLRVQAGA
ncbi:MAG: SpoIIE family protein phosphatase [Planctomycetes bacterium]|nr:SpoIIE family protein phosphatase [Planctomycetota bacterium]